MYRRLCCSDGRRRGGEDVFHLVFDGSFFAVLGFPVSVFCDSSRLGLGFQSLPSFSGMGFAVGKWVSVLFHERGLHSNIFICRGFDFGELLFVPFLCANFQILCVLSWVACASHVFGGAKSVFYIRPAAWWSLGAFAGDVFIGIFCCYSLFHRRSFMSQLESDSGWLFAPTFGGSATLLGSSSPGDVGFLEVLDASDPSLPVDCLPARSAFQQHVDPDMLLKTAPKKLVLRQGGGRHQAGSSGRRRRERPGVLKDWNVFSISFKGVFALWAVITEY